MPINDLYGAPADLKVVLVLGGGNALGAYHAGVYEALHEAGVEPDWVVGTSIGAITGAILAGNAPEDRLGRLRRLWRPAESHSWPMPWDMLPEDWRRTGAVVETLLTGRSGIFGPLGSSGAWPRDAGAGSPAAYDTRHLRDTLAQLVDFDRLNQGAMRYTATAVDVERGDEVLIDTAHQVVTPDHVRASAALLTAFPAVEVDGRLLGDGGLAMNLPIDPVLAEDMRAPMLCIASDLLPLSARRPRTLGEVASRMQDLALSIQSRRTLARWQAAFAADDSARSVTLVTTAYTDQQREVAGKAMDFSATSVRERWACGLADGRTLVRSLRDGDIAVGGAGLTLHDKPPRRQTNAG